jgi:DNA-binding transcriptional LysR family regulator
VRARPACASRPCPCQAAGIADALDSGQIDFAFGFLPTVKDTQRVQLLKDRYIVMLRAGHPFAVAAKRRKGQALLPSLHELEFVAGRTHSDTLRILQLLKLQDRVRLTMSIKSDKWIRRMAEQHGMIEPFEPGQVRQRRWPQDHQLRHQQLRLRHPLRA